VAAIRPNLARRPFVDSRPANVAVVFLLLTAIVLTAISIRTVHAYLEGSRQSRAEIASLRAEIGRFEAAGREAEEKLARFDLAGMQAGAEEANELARLRAFSWSRFLTRLEKTLPNDVRVVSVSLSKPGATKPAARSAAQGTRAEDSFAVALSLVSRDPDGLPKLIRAFYASQWFDAPTPVSETGGEKGSVEGRSFVLDIVYYDREAKP
jgi:Tfp pilus assembly protein PilN